MAAMEEGNRVQPVFSTPGPEYKKHTSLSLSERLGVDDLLSLNVWRASIGELLGTAIFVFMIDVIVISTIESEAGMPNLVLSILIAVLTTILLIAIFPVSGAHINPLISFSAALVGIISMSRALVYILAQCLGGVLGALALKAVVNGKIESSFSLGGCTVNIIGPGPNGPITIGLGTTQAFWIEAICTFIFLFASVSIAYDHRQAKTHGLIPVFSIIGVLLGLIVFISTTVTATKGYGGAGMNPARCFGPAVVRGGHLWDGHWVFWVGPAAGCAAFYVYTKIIPTQHFHADGYKHDFFGIVRTLTTSRR